MPYADRKTQLRKQREAMRRLRRVEKENLNYAESAVAEFLEKTGTINSIASFHKHIGNWGNVNRTVPRSALMYEWLASCFKQRAEGLAREKTQRNFDLLEFALDAMVTYSTLQNAKSRFRALAELAGKLAEVELEVNNSMYEKDKVLAQWLQNLYETFHGWYARSIEAESREKVIAVWTDPNYIPAVFLKHILPAEQAEKQIAELRRASEEKKQKAQEEAEKEQLIEFILIGSKFSREALVGKSLLELRNIAEKQPRKTFKEALKELESKEKKKSKDEKGGSNGDATP